MSWRRRGFTLIELLVVIGIIGLLLAMLVPQLARSRNKARATVCAANLHTLGLGLNLYLDENSGNFFRYYVNTTVSDPLGQGRLWWFGFEPNGPGTTANRPLDKSRSPLAPYTLSLDQRMQCPSFPYDDPLYFPKFDQHAASCGYNITLGDPNLSIPCTRAKYLNRLNSVVAFADAVQFENPTKFNEGHYIHYNANVTSPTAGLDGYAHFRHAGQAQYVLLDGHVESQHLEGPSFRVVAGSPSGNLVGPAGGPAIYGAGF
jgi:prepilin-type N-terminal cleavage/methylation domain-containing protein/prepilin-type processing-associated H-X9-DG protein